MSSNINPHAGILNKDLVDAVNKRWPVRDQYEVDAAASNPKLLADANHRAKLIEMARTRGLLLPTTLTTEVEAWNADNANSVTFSRDKPMSREEADINAMTDWGRVALANKGLKPTPPGSSRVSDLPAEFCVDRATFGVRSANDGSSNYSVGGNAHVHMSKTAEEEDKEYLHCMAATEVGRELLESKGYTSTQITEFRYPGHSWG